jgi:hypothetical protein
MLDALVHSIEATTGGVHTDVPPRGNVDTATFNTVLRGCAAVEAAAALKGFSERGQPPAGLVAIVSHPDFDWAAPQLHPVLVIPGASHFFHAKLPLLKECVKRTLLA